jgi:hypothetical protein
LNFLPEKMGPLEVFQGEKIFCEKSDFVGLLILKIIPLITDPKLLLKVNPLFFNTQDDDQLIYFYRTTYTEIILIDSGYSINLG